MAEPDTRAHEAAGEPAPVASARIAPASPVLAAALAHAGRLDPRSAALLAPALGNRRLARAVLARREGETDVPGVLSFPRSRFDYRFDAEVDTRAKRITLYVKVRLGVKSESFPPGTSKDAMDAEKAAFAAAWPDVIRKAWSYKRALKSPYGERFECDVRTGIVDSGEHVYIELSYPKAGNRSGITPRTPGQTTPTKGDLETDDCKPEWNAWKDLQGGEHQFQHTVAAHEFGHVLGLGHIDLAQVQKTPGPHNQLEEYGDTWEEANDIMGWGMMITAHDMVPWIRAGMVYQPGTWQVVD